MEQSSVIFKFTYKQVLALALQLSNEDKQKLIKDLRRILRKTGVINSISVADLPLEPDEIKPINEEAIVGKWPGDETIEELLEMLKK